MIKTGVSYNNYVRLGAENRYSEINRRIFFVLVADA